MYTDQGQAIRLIKLARWIIAMADRRGMTHGEKHHWLFVAAQIMEQALSYLGENDRAIGLSLDTTAEDGDIPF